MQDKKCTLKNYLIMLLRWIDWNNNYMANTSKMRMATSPRGSYRLMEPDEHRELLEERASTNFSAWTERQKGG